jgi:hypothetical protein
MSSEIPLLTSSFLRDGALAFGRYHQKISKKDGMRLGRKENRPSQIARKRKNGQINKGF